MKKKMEFKMMMAMLIGMMVFAGCGSGPESQILGKWSREQVEKIKKISDEILSLETRIKKLDDEYKGFSEYSKALYGKNNRRLREMYVKDIETLRKEVENVKGNPDIIEFLKDGTFIAGNSGGTKYRFLDKERVEITNPLMSKILRVKIENDILTISFEGSSEVEEYKRVKAK